MGRAPCCTKEERLNRGPWTATEDDLLTKCIQAHGEGRWRSVPKIAGLLRCGKSCRLRWVNYLKPDIKRGNITPDEDDLIIRLHSLLGNRWSLIAGRLPGRTDNEIKNYWNTHLSKRHQMRRAGFDDDRPHNIDNRRKLAITRSSPHTQQGLKKRITRARKCNSHNQGESSSTWKARIEAAAERPKIYLPKPCRVQRPPSALLWRSSFETRTQLGAIIRPQYYMQQGGVEEGSLVFDKEPPKGVHNEGSIFKDARRDEEDDDAGGIGCLVGDPEDATFINGSDLGCETPMPVIDNTLDKLYEEYLQLLNTTKEDEEDPMELYSFAESVLV